jgi:hypothetical protein
MTTATNIDEQLAQWAADDAKALAAYKAEQAYNLLIADLTAVEGRVKVERRAVGNFDSFFVADINCDYENAIDAGYAYGTREFWEMCISSAGSAAGANAEAEGLDINALIGRTIY